MSQRGAAAVRLLACALAWCCAPAVFASERTLIVALDSVPFSVVAAATDPGRGEAALFRGFGAPAPLISTFPSSTGVAMVGMLEAARVERSPGYEARYFDWHGRRVRGGGPISYRRTELPWRDFFDWSRRGIWIRAVAGLRPAASTRKRFDTAMAAFLASSRRTWTVYVESTDTLVHLQGPEALEPVLAALDEDLRRARRASPEPLRVVLFSDHGIAGGEPLVNVYRALRRELDAAGYRQTRRLRQPRDVALTPYGLVSSFEAYCRPGEEAELAARLAAVSGVDLCVFPAGGGWTVESARGRASITRRPAAEGEGEEWRYRVETGDPLGYGELAPEGGWRTDAEWFDRTAGHHHPDALYRLAAAFDLVSNPASVLCSLLPGHMYGARTTETTARFTKGRLEWTHGALYREASVGFVMSDDPEWTASGALRFDRGLAPFLGGGAD